MTQNNMINFSLPGTGGGEGVKGGTREDEEKEECYV